MSARRRRVRDPRSGRRSSLYAGAAGLSAALVMAPFAYAETATPVSPSPSPSPSSRSSASAAQSGPPTASVDPTEVVTKSSLTPSPDATSPTPKATAASPTPQPTDASPTPQPTDEMAVRPAVAAPSGTSATGTVSASAVVRPIYGVPKVRVGVQVADGAYVPDGTDTNGSTFLIVETDPEGTFQRSYTCTTGSQPEGDRQLTLCPDRYQGQPENTFTITQTAAAPGFVLDPRPIIVGPCEVAVEGQSCALNTVTFRNSVVSPTATDDETTVDNTEGVNVAVLANDDTQGAPILSLEVSEPAAHGATAVTADDPDHLIRYTPNPGFVGTDTFGYSYQTANGSATGTVTVQVTGEALPPRPNYGFQKVRVGVQIADGAYVPEGTTTAGSTLTLVRTSSDGTGEPIVTECTTVAADPESTDSYCAEDVLVFPGYELTVTQATAQPGLVLNPQPVVIPPCVIPIFDRPGAATIIVAPTCEDKDAIIIDRVLAPTATDDETTVVNTEGVNVAVLANDDTQGAPILSLEVTQPAANGTTTVSEDELDSYIRYTPNPGFVGTDTFGYSYLTANGTATGTVTVTVTGEALPPTPNYGLQKVRVGVQIADGAYVPEGTTTAGTTLTLTWTSSNGPVETRVGECTTVAVDPGSTDSYCPGDVIVYPGEELEVTQATAQPGLLLNPEPIVIPPCVIPIFDRPGAAAIVAPPTCGNKEAIIIDRVAPPSATDDKATVDNTKDVDVAVLANDDTQDAPVLSFAVSKAAAHGQAQVSGEASDGLVRYIPAAGYIGTDTFDYTYRTANGSATATVTIRVTGAASTPPTEAPDPTTAAPPTSSNPTSTNPATGNLATTGGPAGAGLGVGAGLLLSGAGASLLARRRRAGGRHV